MFNRRVWWFGVATCCMCQLVGAAARPAAAQGAAEVPVAPGSLGGSGALGGAGSPLLTFGDDPNRQLVINGFGVLGYDYDLDSGKSSFAASALALSLYKGISDQLSVFAQLTASRPPPSPFLADVGATNDITTDN